MAWCHFGKMEVFLVNQIYVFSVNIYILQYKTLSVLSVHKAHELISKYSTVSLKIIPIGSSNFIIIVCGFVFCLLVEITKGPNSFSQNNYLKMPSSGKLLKVINKFTFSWIQTLSQTSLLVLLASVSNRQMLKVGKINDEWGK